MSLFQRSFYAPEQSFTNLFRLLDDYDTYQQQQQGAAEAAGTAVAPNGKAVATASGGNAVAASGPRGAGARGALTAPGRLFNPRFDVRETENTYELHGELPGVDRKDVSIEFTEPQTLVVSGSIERNYETSSPEEEEKDTTAEAATSETSHKATVTDEATEAAKEKGEVEKEDTSKSSAPAERYWYSERSIGSFHRTFAFPAPVDEANVKAGLDNGILNISIPKAVKRSTRRIAIN